MAIIARDTYHCQVMKPLLLPPHSQRPLTGMPSHLPVEAMTPGLYSSMGTAASTMAKIHHSGFFFGMPSGCAGLFSRRSANTLLLIRPKATTNMMAITLT